MDASKQGTWGFRAGFLVFAALVIGGGSLSAAAYVRPGRTVLVSVASDGVQGDGQSAWPVVTADGRYVAFQSKAANLVPGDTNVCSYPILGAISCSDAFVHDRATGATERVSVASDGTEGNENSGGVSLSADARYAAFVSSATNLVPGDTNRATDVFVHDRETGSTERVSVSSGGTQGGDNMHSFGVSLSADGRYAAFVSTASNLVPGDTNGTHDVFVHDRQTGATERVSLASDGSQMGGTVASSISANGRYVAFDSNVNVLPGDTNGTTDVFVHDRQTGTTERVSVASDGTQGNGHSLYPFNRPSLSPDGRYVVFNSFASNLVPGDTNLVLDAFVHDRQTGATERVSVASDGSEGNGSSSQPSISADGRYVGFNSWASNLVPNDTNWNPTTFDGMDVFVRDRETRVTDRVSVASDGTQADLKSADASLSADGRYVTFWSWATNLVAGDTNGPQTPWIGDGEDVFVHDRGLPIGIGEISALPEGDRITVSGRATLSGQVVSSVTDQPSDGVPGAGPVGAELMGASLTYRPEQEDLLVRLDLTSLPGLGVCWGPLPLVLCPGTGAGAPGLLYGLEFNIGNARFEVRAHRSAPDDVALTVFPPPTTARFGLYRCDPDCTEEARLTGGIGTTGSDVLVSVPLSLLGGSEGAALQGIRAFTAPGDAATGPLLVLDEVDVPDVTIPDARVSLGIASAGTPEGEVVFELEADLVDGAFSGSVDASSLPAGDYKAWARACVGERCGTTSRPIRLG